LYTKTYQESLANAKVSAQQL